MVSLRSFLRSQTSLTGRFSVRQALQNGLGGSVITRNFYGVTLLKVATQDKKIKIKTENQKIKIINKGE